MFLSRTSTSVSSHKCGKLVYIATPTWTYHTGRSPRGRTSVWEAELDENHQSASHARSLETRFYSFYSWVRGFCGLIYFPSVDHRNLHWTFYWVVNFKMTSSVFSTSCFGLFFLVFLRLLEKKIYFGLLLWSTARSLETITVCKAQWDFICLGGRCSIQCHTT